MRSLTWLFALPLLLSTGAQADIGPFLITFDELEVGDGVCDFYSGGHTCDGARGRGPNYGIRFTPGLIVAEADPYNGPGRSASLRLATMNVADGYSGLLAFYYFAGPLSIRLYDELDGAGALVAEHSFPGVSEFTPGGYFVPHFHSAVFSAPDGAMIDTFGSMAPIPEPTSILLVFTATGCWCLRFAAAKRQERR